LKSGVPNAIAVARDLREQGHELRGIRIDSGDLAYLSREARRMLDQAGFTGVRIVVSNELDEHVIESVRSEGGRVDVYGVGTSLATCAGAGGGALGGVYKLVEIDGEPKLKVTGDIAKATLPGRKKLFRFVEPGGGFIQDVVCLDGEVVAGGDTVFDPLNPLRQTVLPATAGRTEFRKTVMESGRRVGGRESLEIMTERCKRELGNLPSGCLRLINPHRYKVSISHSLNSLRGALIEKAGRGLPSP
jgi:nicotinate phosphoribosyltransferase